MIIVLMGYMGSGKSTIGKDLAKVLQYEFLDLDDYISNKEKETISNIFEKKGELYFRKKEAFYLNEIIDSKDSLVLALGGGTPCYGNNLEVILKSNNIALFYLKVSIPKLTERLFVERNKRPLIRHIKTETDLMEFIGKHLFERAKYYSEAKYTVNSDGAKQDIIESILMMLI